MYQRAILKTCVLAFGCRGADRFTNLKTTGAYEMKLFVLSMFWTFGCFLLWVYLKVYEIKDPVFSNSLLAYWASSFGFLVGYSQGKES